MTDKQSNSSSGGWRRALYDWLLGPPPAPEAHPIADPPAARREPTRIGHYAIVRKLGEGGMGVVYAARDERLERTVALKIMSSLADDEVARQRFWREARAAASVNHPNICQIHEIGEDGGTLFIAMELLEGEPLAERLRTGPLGAAEAVRVALGMLAALSALHGRGLVHRDLKPSNVFLTRHGVKLLDFGLARPGPGDRTGNLALTQSGIVIGTPRYMAPEQAVGEPVDARADIFAAGAILFEMLTGRPAFIGQSIVDVLHATVHEHPPALSGSPVVTAIDRVIRKALAKRPADRFQTADDLAARLREVPARNDDTQAVARALTRIVVLPFRVLRADPETDFLAFSLPDAIATSLSRVGSLIVRSSATAARFAAGSPDLKVLAAEADVDRVVMGTLLRGGDQIRATVQLIETPGGTLLAAHTIHSPLGDLFALQDDIAQRVVATLSLPLGGDVPSPRPEAPRSARAYELYLRGNELARSYVSMPEAREHYLRALELDPQFAPAWAQLGRCHRVIGKYVDVTPDSNEKAQEALQRALALEPRLSVAHKYLAALESEIGEAPKAMVRLLREAARHGNDPELFAGLVQTCRFCGLYEEGIAAHTEARRLDPHIATSVEQTLLMTTDFERLFRVGPAGVGGADQGIRVMALALQGRREEARQSLLVMRQAMTLPAFQSWTDYLMAWIDGRIEDMRARIAVLNGLKIQDDPEAMCVEAWMFCEVGDHETGLRLLQRAVRNGYYAAPTLERSRHFDALRSNPAFLAVQAEAAAGRRRALEAFHEAGGERLLGRQPVLGAI